MDVLVVVHDCLLLLATAISTIQLYKAYASQVKYSRNLVKYVKTEIMAGLALISRYTTHTTACSSEFAVRNRIMLMTQYT